MAKIIKFSNLEKELGIIRQEKKSIVLIGGCFDILHVGHIRFLEEAKKEGDCLLVLLESDATVTRLKGSTRPHFSQNDRAEVLSSIKYVDYVILLPPMTADEEYVKLTVQIRPDIIAVTENDPLIAKKRHQAEMVGGKIAVIPYLKTHSSSKLAKLLGVE